MMTQGKLIVIVLVALVIGFVGGFVLRPVLAPGTPAAPDAAVAAAAAPRSVQYFAAHIDEARQVVAGCREGTLRGDECANADQAVITADSRERTERFLGKRP